MNTRAALFAALAAISLALGAAAVADEAAAPTNARSPSAPGAEVRFANLEDGAVVPPVFTVRFEVTGMAVAPAGTPGEFTGHHHLLVDLEELPPMDQPLPMNDHVRHFGKGQTETELELSPGPHTLQLLLADYAHVPHDPPVMSEVITVIVKPVAAEGVAP